MAPGITPRGKKDKDKDNEKNAEQPVVNIPTLLNRADDLIDDAQALELLKKLFESRAKVRLALLPIMPTAQQGHRLNTQIQNKLKDLSSNTEKEKQEAQRRITTVEQERDSLRKENRELRAEIQKREKELWKSEQDLQQAGMRLTAMEKEASELRRFKKELQSRRRSLSPTPRMKTPRMLAEGETNGGGQGDELDVGTTS